jgi:hypothetical protein
MVARKKKKARSKSVGFLTAKIGRVDDPLMEVSFTKGQTIQALLDKAGLSLSSGESVNDRSANEVEADEEAKAGMTYVVVGNYKNGN